MSENYIKNHFEDIRGFACVIESRLYDDCTLEDVLKDNKAVIEMAAKAGVQCTVIDDKYEINIEL